MVRLAPWLDVEGPAIKVRDAPAKPAAGNALLLELLPPQPPAYGTG